MTVKVPHYAQKLPRHMANDFTQTAYLLCPLPGLLEHLESTQLYKKYGSRVQHSAEHKWPPLGLPYHAASIYATVESWLATPNSAAHAHLAIGA